MYQVKFDPNGSALNVEINYKGILTASYDYTLWEANSNAIVAEHFGNNQNDQDDSYDLPNPVKNNENRLIDVFSTLRNSDDSPQQEVINIKVYQGNKKIGNISETEIVDANKTVINEIFIKLVTN